MDLPNSADLTQLIQSASHGDANALEKITPCIYPVLQSIAKGYRRRQSPGCTLQTTDIVHEAYLKIFQGTNGDRQYQNRLHFFAVSARAMRCVLVDHARKKRREPRRDPTPLDELVDSYEASSGGLEALDQALEKLKRIDPEAEQIVNLKFWIGFSTNEIADVLGISARGVQRKFQISRAWLREELKRGSRSLGAD